jgi:hypothetical protein
LKLTTIGTVIATRTLDLPRGRRVIVKIGKPRKFRGDDSYFCPFEIHGLATSGIRYAGGVDPVQALELAMKIIGVTLYISNESKAGKLTWLGDRNLGFPVTDNCLDLVPQKGSRTSVKQSEHRPSSRTERKTARSDRARDRPRRR